jgi:2-polyprenyl-3-methyl-5-hydroxy-6-metoxy-1,4-benzoquinol methylase
MADKKNLGPIEKQYSSYFANRDSIGNEVLGSMATDRWRSDSKLLGVTLSRYKFVSKMFTDFKSVLEIGAADGWYSRLVFNEVKKLTLSDFDEIWLDDFKSQDIYRKSETEYLIHNFVSSPLHQVFDGVYALDVLEHIKPTDQSSFLTNVCTSLSPQGVAIFGMPSAESQVYASEASKMGHVNCQSGEELRDNLKTHFENVFIFSMSDEVVHTGFMPMAHYLIALCTGPFKKEIIK